MSQSVLSLKILKTFEVHELTEFRLLNFSSRAFFLANDERNVH